MPTPFSTPRRTFGMADLVIADNVSHRTRWCQICGEYAASPVDVIELRELLAQVGHPKPDAPGQAHPRCMVELRDAAQN